jgi:opacity protein-like surface antigen
MKRLVWLLIMLTAPACAQPRAGTDEWSLNLFVVGTKQYTFEGGATARNDGGAGIGLTLTRNLNDYFALGLDASLSEFNYRATVVGAAGSFQTDGDMETGALRAHVTWNLLARPVTPFLTASAGVMFLDTNLAGDPPGNACWIYPWYGEVCGDKAPTNTLTRFTYGIGAGLRYELPREQGFVRAMLGAEWIDFREALSPVGYVLVRADFGLRF